MPRKFSTAILDTLLKTVEVDFKVPFIVGEVKFPATKYAKEWWENEKTREALLNAIDIAEQKFVTQNPENKAAQILHDFSLKNEADFQKVIAELLKHLDEQKITWLMADKLGKGFENVVSNKELHVALNDYFPYLQDELSKIKEFREAISYLRQKKIERTTNLTYETAQEIKDMLLERQSRESSNRPSTVTTSIEKTVFISYRRTNYWTALAVFQNLNANGYDVFLDYKSIPSGDFEQVITENIKSRAHFIVILSPSALESCQEPRDWLRREIELAIENKRNIIPLIMEGFDFGSAATTNALTGNLVNLKKYNAISIPAEYFDEAMVKLRGDRFLNRPLESVYFPVSDITKQITQEQKFATSKAPPVKKEQLSAEELLESAIPMLLLGIISNRKVDISKAKEVFSKAIRVEHDSIRARLGRALAWEVQGAYSSAIKDYQMFLNLGGGTEYNNQKFVEDKLKELKGKLRKKKSTGNNRLKRARAV